jgi:hypothetical protein
VRVAGSVDFNRPADQVWAYVAGVSQMRPSLPGPAQAGVTTRETLRLLGLSFRTDATIYRVDPGHLLEWRAHDRHKQLQGSRVVEPTGQRSCRFTKVVEGRLLGLLRPLEPLVVWLLRPQTTADLRRLQQLLEASANRPAPW